MTYPNLGLFPNLGAIAVNSTLKQADQMVEAARRQLMTRANNAYAGQDLVINQPLKTQSGKPDDNVAINYAETIVDKGVAFLFGDDLNITVGEAESGEAKA